MDDPRIRMFLIYDRRHDVDLRDALVAQSLEAKAAFTIVAQSTAGDPEVDGDERVRTQLRESDEVLVLCGAHTEESPTVADEFRVVLEEEKPYVLLWGRREIMCTKPPGAKPGDAMYSWTDQILDARVREVLRHPRPRSAAGRKPTRA